ncbi:helix-turn-helix transcriptional regulator [Dyadobacter flavalbus]|uniref:Helix-turn-helix transcriptional regulator n=1 Tax=Dyadobacter flavalbus TaxID=2579942 RepID=A0A5M8QWX1_9BACT|nr:AraC family transcriptional regulator [Dyadobacter flavalbus]KAA6439324.1 helix-turn-helix transcriptional regulator [Dyadobacter flavalbus]
MINPKQTMQISYENEQLYPTQVPAVFADNQLYRFYEQSAVLHSHASCVHWFDFETNRAHKLSVHYPDPLYKLVLCIAGNARSVPGMAREYCFSTGQALFYKTEEEPYTSLLAANTAFKVIHIHLSEWHIGMLQNELPVLFEKPVGAMALSSECAAAFLQLKTISKENPGLLRLFEEKLITDQFFNLASQILPRSREKDILQEAIWHMHQSSRYLTISELAHRCGTNSFRIKQLFREELRSSVFQYQSDLQMARAARLLLDTALPVAQVSLQCGYESAAAFSNAFTKKYGMRPLAFKNARLRK